MPLGKQGGRSDVLGLLIEDRQDALLQHPIVIPETTAIIGNELELIFEIADNALSQG